jgi:DNA-binding Lrp family transcriptional regulator
MYPGKNMNINLLDEIEKDTRGALIKRYIINYYIHNGSSTINELSGELNLSIPTVNKREL